MIGALVLAAIRAIAIDALAAFGGLCLMSVLIACVWAFLFRHRRREHVNRRGYP